MTVIRRRVVTKFDRVKFSGLNLYFQRKFLVQRRQCLVHQLAAVVRVVYCDFFASFRPVNY